MSDTKIAGHSTYPSYKTSGMEWLGDVPEHWETTTIRRYCRVFSGATPDRAILNYWDGGTIPWIASGDVNLRRIVKAQQFITEAGYNASSTRYIHPGSLVLALAGQGRTKGMVATVECRTTCNQSLAAIEPSPQVSDYNFLAYYLESRYIDIRALVGNGLRDGLNLEHIRAIQTPLPPLDEQAAIVRYLEDADQRIRAYVSAKERLIALLEELKQAVIHQAVTRGLDPNVRLKPSGVEWLGDVPEHWEVRKLKHVCSQKAQYGANIPASEYTTSGIRFLRTTDITADGAVVGEGVYIPRDLSPECLLNPGDILLTRSGATIGQSFLYDMNEHGECSFAGYLVRFSPSPEMLPKFVYLFTTSPGFQNPVQQSAIVSTIENVNAEKYANIQMPVPPLHEQTIIVRHLDELTKRVDLAIDRARRQIELMEEYRTRLIADVVTGKIDVREAANTT